MRLDLQCLLTIPCWRTVCLSTTECHSPHKGVQWINTWPLAQVQALVRMRSARGAFTARKRAAVVLQAAWRGRSCRSALRVCSAGATICRYARCWLARRRLQRCRVAATAIQAAVRMHFCRKQCALDPGKPKFIIPQECLLQPCHCRAGG